MTDEQHREKFPSFEEISEKIDLMADDLKKLRQERSDPPQLRWIDRRIGAAVRKAGKAILIGALTALGAGAAGWAMRDCQAKVESADAGTRR